MAGDVRSGGRAGDGMVTDPYWWDGIDMASRPAADLPQRADVVVVGSGVTGLHAALALARAGRQVVVAEAGRIGFGASTRNNGMVVPYLRMPPGALRQAFGEDRGRRLTEAGIASFRFVVDFIAAEGIDCGLTHNERYLLGLTSGHFHHLCELAEEYRAHGVPAGFEVRSAAELTGATGLSGYAGAIVTNASYSLHPGLYHRGLAGLAEAAGAVLAPATRVETVRRDGMGRFAVATSRGPIAATQVVLATNGYGDDLMPWLRRRVIPITAYMAASEPIAPEVMRRRFPGPRSFTTSRRNLTWIRTSPDGTRILFGGRTGMAEGSLHDKARRLVADAARVVPELDGVRVSHCWAGDMGFTFDGVPHLGEVEGCHYAAGFCGVGLTVGSWLGRRLAERILAGGADAGRTPFEDGPFTTRFYYRRSPWFVPWAVRKMNLQDRWDLRHRPQA